MIQYKRSGPVHRSCQRAARSVRWRHGCRRWCLRSDQHDDLPDVLARSGLTCEQLSELLYENLDNHEVNAGLTRVLLVNDVDGELDSGKTLSRSPGALGETLDIGAISSWQFEIPQENNLSLVRKRGGQAGQLRVSDVIETCRLNFEAVRSRTFYRAIVEDLQISSDACVCP